MKRLYHTTMGQGDSEDTLPQVLGYPSPAVTYDPSSPGTTFDIWNANLAANTRAYASPIVQVQKNFSFTATTNPDLSTAVWTPPTSWPFYLADVILHVTGITLTGAGSPSNVSIDVVMAASAGVGAYGTLLHWESGTSVNNWSTSGSNQVWSETSTGKSGWQLGLQNYTTWNSPGDPVDFATQGFDNGRISWLTGRSVMNFPMRAENSTSPPYYNYDEFCINVLTTAVPAQVQGRVSFIIVPYVA